MARTPSMLDTLDLSTPGTASMFDEASLWAARFGALMLDHLEVRDNLDVLDVGCGTGLPLIELAGLHGEGSRFTGVDTWADALQRARAKIAWLGMSNVNVVEADAASLPFPDAAFDLIVSNLGLNNFARPEVVFAECARVARPGARLVITTNTRDHMREVYDVFREVKDARYRNALEENVAHRATRAQLERRYMDAGFEVTRFVEKSFAMTFANGSSLLRHPLTRWFGWREIVSKEDFERIFNAIEARVDAPIRTTIPMFYIEGVRSRAA
jgi:ubiquinone/menaquinone biosynthesis C-methylase UbiE